MNKTGVRRLSVGRADGLCLRMSLQQRWSLPATVSGSGFKEVWMPTAQRTLVFLLSTVCLSLLHTHANTRAHTHRHTHTCPFLSPFSSFFPVIFSGWSFFCCVQLVSGVIQTWIWRKKEIAFDAVGVDSLLSISKLSFSEILTLEH